MSRAAGLVFVTHELCQHHAYRRFSKPSIVIANGTELPHYVVEAKSSSPPPRLVFIGQDGCVWHGTDKLGELAVAFPDWHFDIVGVSGGNYRAAKSSNMVFHGELPRAEYCHLLSRADCAIGTLALHRNGLNEACPLKTREYLAAGLPVITGYNDTDFPQKEDFILQLPNNEANVRSNLARIERFVCAWKGRAVSRSSIAHIDWRRKEADRLKFFDDVNNHQKKRGTSELKG